MTDPKPRLKKYYSCVSTETTHVREPLRLLQNSLHQFTKLSAEIVEETIALLFPARCICCSIKTSERWVCETCSTLLSTLLRRPINSCKTCSEPLPIEGSPEEICIHCRLFPLGASNFDSLFLYKAPIETLIKSWKYGNQEHIGNFFAEKLRDQLDTGIHTGKEIILSIPSSPSNTRIRGFFPLGEMCRKLSKSLSIPYYPLALRLSNNHQAQSKVKIASRVQNIANKIKLDDTDITGKDVILIDDVATTGSSIKAASHLLNSAGVNSIKAVTIARSPRFQANRLNANISYDTVNKHTPRRAFA